MSEKENLLNEKKALAKEKENLIKSKKILGWRKKKILKSKKSLLKENTKLRKEIKILKPIVDKFTLSSQKLQIILNDQKTIFDKIGIDFSTLQK